MPKRTKRTRNYVPFHIRKDTFFSTIRLYASLRSIGHIVALQISPDPSDTPRRLTIPLHHYLLDVEIATEKALQGDPALERAWFALAMGEKCDEKLAHEVIEKCGLAYHRRGIDPLVYFRNKRLGDHDDADAEPETDTELEAAA